MVGVDYDELVFNSSRFVINSMGNMSPPGVNKLFLYYAFGKLGTGMQAYNSARAAYEKLQSLKVPNEWQEEIDLASLTIKAKPFVDREDLLTICSRCMSSNSLLNLSGTGDICTSCKHPLIRSFISFTPLPLVEFEPDD